MSIIVTNLTQETIPLLDLGFFIEPNQIITLTDYYSLSDIDKSSMLKEYVILGKLSITNEDSTILDTTASLNVITVQDKYSSNSSGGINNLPDNIIFTKSLDLILTNSLNIVVNS